MEGHSRRDLIRIAAGAVAAVPALAQQASADVKPLFFTPAEFQMLDELTEIIIPTDSHSPGRESGEGGRLYR